MRWMPRSFLAACLVVALPSVFEARTRSTTPGDQGSAPYGRPSSELPDGQAAFVLGTIRWGRTDEQKVEIVSELRRSVATALGCADSEVGVVTVDIPSKWNMEGGSLLPEPGEEGTPP